METAKKYLPLNFELLSNPINWLIVLLMVITAGIALSLVFGMKAKSEGNS